MSRPPCRVTVGVAVATLVLAGCQSDRRPADRPTSPEVPATPTTTTAAQANETVDLLDWSPAPGPVEATLLVGGGWQLSRPASGASATLEGPTPATIRPPAGYRVSDVLLDQDYAVVVAQDRQEAKPGHATVINLATGHQFTVDSTSSLPPANGGSWALGDDLLLYPTFRKSDYCLAEMDLAAGDSTIAYCSPPRHGYTNVEVTPDGISILSFDDKRPSCRTPATISDGEAVALPGVTDCKGWDSALLSGGAIWSIVPKENRIEAAHYYAAVGPDVYDLGPGNSDGLAWCAGAAYFARDPQHDGDRSEVLRWTPDGTLSVVYRSPRAAQSFLTGPDCGGDHLTVHALTSAGDEVVTAPIG